MIKQKQKYKIVLIGDCLAFGGAEKVHALMSVYLEKKGFDVHNCIMRNEISYDYAGSLLNLGTIKPDSGSFVRKTSRFFAIKKMFRQNKYDFVIDFRMRQNFLFEFIVSKFLFPRHTFYTVHSGVWHYYFPKSIFLSNLIYKNRILVTVSEAIKNTIVSKKIKAETLFIPNPFDLKAIAALKREAISESSKYIVAAGSMHSTIKQFDVLIRAFSKSALPEKNIRLILLGDGRWRKTYENLARSLHCSDKIEFRGYVQNPFPYYEKSEFYVLSSKNEGFPSVLVEALATGTPVVAFNCFSGPSEIITDRKNGLLVENQSEEKLVSALNEMVFDQKLYYHCKENAMASVSDYDIEIIGQKWLEILQIKS